MNDPEHKHHRVGTAWLFLLPAGVFGFALLLVAVCVLITRSRKRQTTRSETTAVEQD